MTTVEKSLLTQFSKAKVVNVASDGKLSKVQFVIPQVPGDVVIEAWIGNRVTFCALVNGDSVRLHPKSGVRFENLEQWLRETAKGV